MLGFAAQSLLMTAAVSIPILFPDSLPKVQTVIGIFAPGPPAPPPPPPPEIKAGPRFPRTDPTLRALVEPTSMPTRAVSLDEPPVSVADANSGTGVVGGMRGGTGDGVIGSIATSAVPAPPPPRQVAAQPKTEPAVAVKPAAPSAPVPVSGGVQEAKLVHRVIPAYPPLAKQARISGKVELTGFIAVDGRIRQLQVLSGHPLLVPAALEAVRQWVYRPTLLNGEPVEVVAPITVHFILN
jgi:periplasmic protein TonB